MGVRDKVFVSWVGLRGAVPIIFAIIILAEDVPHADLIFNIVFICTLVSLLVQGTSIPMVAKWLSLAEKRMRERKHRDFDIEFADDIKSITDQIEIKESMLQKGNQLMDLPLPEKTLVIMIKREDIYMVPKGNTVLQPRDKLLVITDNQLTLQETYDNLKVPTDN
jgi:cell volume regulation protein A